ncbi:MULTISPECIES: hypothetical protein [unclassified Streptomyces]|uniref:hypothetical protein n=1 Tax=unclassified Streptomyces TaxID=2593676 RepID=UPI0036495B8E
MTLHQVFRCSTPFLVVIGDGAVMKVDASFWDSLMFDGIDDVDVEAVTAAFARSMWWREAGRPGRRVRIAVASRTECTTAISAR